MRRNWVICARRTRIVMNRFELLYVAKAQAAALAEAATDRRSGAQYPGGRSSGIATIKGLLVNMREGDFISEHDYLIGTKIANVMCGGELTPAAWSMRNGFSSWSGRLHGAAGDREDSGAHRAYAEDRQAAAELARVEKH